MKIYLVTPRNPPSFWTYDDILPDARQALHLPESLDADASPGSRRASTRSCSATRTSRTIDFDVDADIVGVTGYIVHRSACSRSSTSSARRGRFVVVGGPYASLCPEELRGRCDVLFVDEAEETWPRFLRDFAGRQLEDASTGPTRSPT